MFRRNLLVRLCCLLGLFLIAGTFSSLNAKETSVRASLRGRVLDQNRAAIPGATVRLEGSRFPAAFQRLPIKTVNSR